MKDHITLLGTLPPIKGVTDYCIELTNALSNHINIEFINLRKLYPEFLYPDKSGTEDKELRLYGGNFKVVNITYYNPFSWIRAGLTRNKIVHAQWWTFYLFPIYFLIFLLLKFRSRKIILTTHNVIGHESGFLDRSLSSIIYKFPKRIIAHSDKNMEQLNTIFKIPRNRLVKIPHGIYNFYRDKKLSKKDARKTLNIKDSFKVILFIGIIRDYKGLDLLIRAFGKVNKNVKNSKLIIAGPCWQNWEKYNKLIKEFGLEKDVILSLKYVSKNKMKYFFESTDLLVLPYRRFESQSGPGNIALAFHKPLIVTNVGGLSELVIDKKFIVEPNNPEKLAKAIITALKSKNTLEKMSEDSKKLSKVYSWENIAKKTVKLYKELV